MILEMWEIKQYHSKMELIGWIIVPTLNSSQRFNLESSSKIRNVALLLNHAKKVIFYLSIESVMTWFVKVLLIDVTLMIFMKVR